MIRIDWTPELVDRLKKECLLVEIFGGGEFDFTVPGVGTVTYSTEAVKPLIEYLETHCLCPRRSTD